MPTYKHGGPHACEMVQPHLTPIRGGSEAFQETTPLFPSPPFPVTVLTLHVSFFTLREPDVPAWAPLLYQLQLLDTRDKPDPLSLPVADRIRIGNQKRERGNFHFQREEYCLASRAYSMALSVLTTRGGATARGKNLSLFTDNIYLLLPGNAVIGDLCWNIRSGNITLEKHIFS